jgi:tol-pal system protein YbgF
MFFKQARALSDSGNVVGAMRALDTFVRTWPRHSYTDNALHLMGRMRFQRAEYGAALDTFRRVVTEHPTGNQVPDALLMMGLSLDRMGQLAKARETLSRLKSMYPNTDAARRAGAELLNISGRM